MTPMLSRMSAVASKLSVTPPFRKFSKKPGPTCKPMQNTNKISPKSCAKERIVVGAVNPMCPATIPAKSTKVTPSEMPHIFILPNKTPTEMTTAYNKMMWAIDSVFVNKLTSHSILIHIIFSLAK